MSAILIETNTNNEDQKTPRLVVDIDPGFELPPSPADMLLRLAQEAHEAENNVQAEVLYRNCLRIDPNCVAAKSLLALLLIDEERKQELEEQNPEARALIEEAVEAAPRHLETQYHRALLYSRIGRLVQAADILQQIVKLDPGNGAAVNLYAGILSLLGRWKEVLSELGPLARANPGDQKLQLAMGHALVAERRNDEALQIGLRLLDVTPEDPGAIALVAASHTGRRNYAEANALWAKATDLAPEDAMLRLQLAISYYQVRSYEKSLETLKEFEKLNKGPLPLIALEMFAQCHKERKEYDIARDYTARALDIEPDNSGILNNASLLEVTMGYLDSGIAMLQKAAKNKDNPGVYSNLLFVSNYRIDITTNTLLDMHRAYMETMPEAVVTPRASLPNSKSKSRRLKIGYVSPDLGTHPVGFFTLAVITRHDPEKFDVYCYSDRTSEDPMGAKIRNASHHWRRTADRSMDELYTMVQNDQIDILIDLAGHTASNRLPVFARRAAPVQATWAGYVGTTGLPTMDYIIADRFHVPPELEKNAVEKIWRMPNGYITYEPFSNAPIVAPSPALENGYVTFCSFSNPCKINPICLDTWAEILAAVPGSRMSFRYVWLDSDDNKRRISDAFAKRGVSADRLSFAGGSPLPEMMNAYNRCDIMLDTFPYSGGLTACEALWMGLPVVTFPGDRFCGRHAFSHTSNSGIVEGIAHSREDYVAKAVALASDIPALAQLRAEIRPRMAASPLCDADQFAKDFEAALTGMWHQWCDTAD